MRGGAVDRPSGRARMRRGPARWRAPSNAASRMAMHAASSPHVPPSRSVGEGRAPGPGATVSACIPASLTCPAPGGSPCPLAGCVMMLDSEVACWHWAAINWCMPTRLRISAATAASWTQVRRPVRDAAVTMSHCCPRSLCLPPVARAVGVDSLTLGKCRLSRTLRWLRSYTPARGHSHDSMNRSERHAWSPASPTLRSRLPDRRRIGPGAQWMRELGAGDLPDAREVH